MVGFNTSGRWSQYAVMMDEWKPVRVVKLDRELAHEEQRLPGLEREVTECKERIDAIKHAIDEEMKRD